MDSGKRSPIPGQQQKGLCPVRAFQKSYDPAVSLPYPSKSLPILDGQPVTDIIQKMNGHPRQNPRMAFDMKRIVRVGKNFIFPAILHDKRTCLLPIKRLFKSGKKFLPRRSGKVHPGGLERPEKRIGQLPDGLFAGEPPSFGRSSGSRQENRPFCRRKRMSDPHRFPRVRLPDATLGALGDDPRTARQHKKDSQENERSPRSGP